MRNSNARKIDVIVVLGGGISADGILSSATEERLDGLLKKSGRLPRVPIVLSGRYNGFMKTKPHTTEAQEMKNYLVRRGIESRQIIKESESLDTISNAVFVKRIVEKHQNWKKILLITSDSHMKRALWIFQRILGKSHKIVPLTVVSSKTKRERRKNYEQYLLAVARRFLKNVPMSSKALIRLLKNRHPFYSESERTERLLKDIISHKKKISA